MKCVLWIKPLGGAYIKTVSVCSVYSVYQEDSQYYAFVFQRIFTISFHCVIPNHCY